MSVVKLKSIGRFEGEINKICFGNKINKKATKFKHFVISNFSTFFESFNIFKF